MNNTNNTAGSGLHDATCSRFFIARPGDITPKHHLQAWHEWEVVDHHGQDRICLTSSKRKAEMIRDALESSMSGPQGSRKTSVDDDPARLPIIHHDVI